MMEAQPSDIATASPGGKKWAAEDDSLPAPFAVRALIVLFDLMMIATIVPAALFVYAYTNVLNPTDEGRVVSMQVERRFSHTALRIFSAPTHYLSLRATPAETAPCPPLEGWTSREFWEGTQLGSPVELRVHRGRWGMAFAKSIAGSPATTLATARGQFFASSAFTTLHRWLMTEATLPTALPSLTDATPAPSSPAALSTPRPGNPSNQVPSSIDAGIRDRFVGQIHGKIDVAKLRKGSFFGAELQRVIRSLGDEALAPMIRAFRSQEAAAELAESLHKRILSTSAPEASGPLFQDLLFSTLEGMDSPQAIDALVQAVKSTDLPEGSRSRAALRLGRLKHRPALLVLGRLLSDPSPIVRKAAAIALGDMPSRKTFGSLCRTALHDDAWVVRQACAETLGRGDDLEARNVLERLLEDEKGGVRAAAALALGTLGARDAVPSLIRLLERDGSYVVRREAATALGKLRNPLAAGALKAALKDAKPDVVLAAAEALYHLGEDRGKTALSYLSRKGASKEIREKAAAVLRGR